MKINLKVIGENLPSGRLLSGYVNKKVRSTLKNSKHYIDEVVVRIADMNGPKGGVDKMCSIQLSIPGQSPVFVKSQEENIYSAISKAAKRAAHKCQRRIRKRQFFSSGGKLKRYANNTDFLGSPLTAS